MRFFAVLLWLLAGCRTILGIEDGTVGDAGQPLPLVAFEFPESGADELAGMLEVPVVLSEATDASVSINFTLVAGTALPGIDFNGSSGALTFAPGETVKAIPVVIVSDTDETEAAEDFTVVLSSPLGALLDDARANHRVNIADHILPRVTVGPASTTSGEASPSNLVIHLDKPSEGQSTVTLGVAGSGAAPATAADYTIVNDTVVVIPDGATMVSVPIGEKNDTLDEEDAETMLFTLKGASLNLVLGTSKTQTHSITDDDLPPIVGFQVATATTAENIGTGVTQAVVVLSAPSGRTVRVDYTRNAADSTDGNDATVSGTPGTLTFSPGDTSESILIGITNDNIDEDDETVIIDLANALNATLNLPTHTLTVQDNDSALVRYALASSTVDEDDAGGASISVVLTAPSAKTVTVPFTRTGTATSDDFTVMTSSPLVFNPGVTQLNIVIDIPENSPGTEANETVILGFGTPTNTTATTPSSHTLTIQE